MRRALIRSRAMKSLARLSSSIDEQLPQLLIFALLRWLFIVLSSPIRRRLALAVARRAPRALDGVVDSTRRLCLIAITAYFGAVSVSGDLCAAQRAPRPLGIAAAVSLAIFVLSWRLTVTGACVVTLLCVRDLAVTAYVAAVATFALWARPEGGALIVLGAVPLSAMHATKCKSPPSAALAVLCGACTARTGTVKIFKWLYKRVRRRF